MRRPVRGIAVIVSLATLVACGGKGDSSDSPQTDQALRPTSSQPLSPVPPPLPWAIATANPLATQAGARVLDRGGSAVDAAIAVQAVLGLVEPQSSGFGGGAFMMYFNAKTGEVTAYDGREYAPASATPTMFMRDDGTPMPFYDAVLSGKAVGVPGVVAMLEMAHLEHGVLPWKTLFSPAEKLAVQGFEVSPRLSSLLGRFGRLADNSAARALYYDDQGKPLAAGMILANPDYAQTLRDVAEGGADAFYHGTIAQLIVNAVNQKAGAGTMTMADLDAYRPMKRPTVCGQFLTYKICSMGPPSSGGVTVLQILGLVERTAPKDMSQEETWARYIEASRLSYADRALYLADPKDMGSAEVSADEIVQGLVAPEYLDARALLIGDHAAPNVEAGDPTPFILKNKRAKDASPDLPGTSHFSILDSQGNIVSMTTTVEFAFGSHLMAGGMILNNQLTDFSFLPERDGVPVANAVAPFKRPRSSMSPVVVMNQDGTPEMAIGSPGGPAIIGYVAKTLLASLAWDMPLQDAIDHPNIVVPRGKVAIESGASEELIAALKDYGYTIYVRDLTSGLYGFRLGENGQVEGAADGRREGTFATSIN